MTVESEYQSDLMFFCIDVSKFYQIFCCVYFNKVSDSPLNMCVNKIFTQNLNNYIFYMFG